MARGREEIYKDRKEERRKEGRREERKSGREKESGGGLEEKKNEKRIVFNSPAIYLHWSLR